jgi:hypothetical protein
MSTESVSYASTPQAAGMRAVGYPATTPHVARMNVVGKFAAMTFSGAMMEGTPVSAALLVEKFSFGWQAIEVLNFSCRLSIHREAYAARKRLMLGMPPIEGKAEACVGQSVDAGPRTEIEAIRKAMEGPLVPSVLVSGAFAAGTWYGAGGGEAIFHKVGGRWVRIAGGGGDHSVDDLRALGVSDSASCAFGKVNACVDSHSEDASSIAMYARTLRRLRASVRIPILLPMYLKRFADTPPLDSTIVDSSNGGYFLSIDPRGCESAHACHIFTVTGYPLASSPIAAGRILTILANGTRAFYTHFICGSSCGDSTLVWDTPTGYRYSVGIKAGNENELVRLANSMHRF